MLGCAVPEDMKDLPKTFQSFLGKFGTSQPLVLLLEGLDRISDRNFGREVDRWIPVNFPFGVKIILSMNSDRNARVFPVIRKHIYGQPGFENIFLKLQLMDINDASAVLDTWLTADRRALTAHQRKVLLDGVRACSSPLYLRLAYVESRRWASYTPKRTCRCLTPCPVSSKPCSIG